jgi:hypothetical protein
VNVSESEAKIDRLKKDNDELRARLHDLKIQSESNNNQEEAGDNKFQDEDIVDMKRTIAT